MRSRAACVELYGLACAEAVEATACKYTGKSEITRTLTDHNMIRKRIYFQDFESNSKNNFMKSCEAVFQQGHYSLPFLSSAQFFVPSSKRARHTTLTKNMPQRRGKTTDRAEHISRGDRGGSPQASPNATDMAATVRTGPTGASGSNASGPGASEAGGAGGGGGLWWTGGGSPRLPPPPGALAIFSPPFLSPFRRRPRVDVPWSTRSVYRPTKSVDTQKVSASSFGAVHQSVRKCKDRVGIHIAIQRFLNHGQIGTKEKPDAWESLSNRNSKERASAWR